MLLAVHVVKAPLEGLSEEVHLTIKPNVSLLRFFAPLGDGSARST